MARPIVIAGAGPVGVIAALALARQGISVHLLEAGDQIDKTRRASTTHAATLELLAPLGLVDEVIAQGLIAPRFCVWERWPRRVVAEFDFARLKDVTRYPFAVQCEQHRLTNIAFERLRAFPHAICEFSARVSGVRQFDDRVAVTVERGADIGLIEGDYLIGADGAHSAVRKALAIEFAGFTHPERFLLLTTESDFGGAYDGSARHWFVDPEEWCGLFPVTGEGGCSLWRGLFPTRSDENDAAALDDDAVEQHFQRFHPAAGAYPILHRNAYRVHQRVAAQFRKGRVFLAGDAAHVNNSLGGLGLNFGIHDAVELAHILGRVIRREAPPQMLDLYETRRRSLNIEYVQRQTIANKKLMEEKDPMARAANLDALRRTAENPVAHRDYLMRASLLESMATRERITAPPSMN
jgi:3-(3-hydroxy-phenyl)propionate hydroxylase